MFFRHGKLPSLRAVSAHFKLRGLYLQRKWPIISHREHDNLNLFIEDLLALEASRTAKPCVVCIGAYDGIENDPVSEFIRSKPCEAVLIEPQKEVFRRLAANYKEFEHFQLINKAIDNSSGQRTLYLASNQGDDLPDWVEQLASFDESHIHKHETMAPGVSKNIRREIVETITFDDLREQYSLNRIDILQIDAEGLDDKIISWIPFNSFKPNLIIFEVAHLNDNARQDTFEYLRKKGYRIFPMNSDSDAAAVLV